MGARRERDFEILERFGRAFRDQTAEEIEEAKRLFYVGVTRAEQFLLYVTDSSGRRNGPTRFLLKQTGVGVC